MIIAIKPIIILVAMESYAWAPWSLIDRYTQTDWFLQAAVPWEKAKFGQA